VVTYRRFRNTDPPALADVWNQALTGRGVVRLRHSSPLENYVFNKQYFDPGGLIIAEEAGLLVGFVHAGFGPNATRTGISLADGVTCLLAVRPSHRRRGVGAELLRHAEAYLQGRGATTLQAGPMAPFNPFYFGLYGGSELAGFLESDPATGPFLQKQGYRVERTCRVFHRLLHQPLNVPDARFAALRRRFDMRIVPRSGAASWWDECVMGPIELVDFRLEEKGTGRVFARTSVWEMDGFSWRWNQPSVGVVAIEVVESQRRQGLAKFLLSQMLRYLQEQFFGIAEVQALDDNGAALGLFRGLGFEQVDVGHRYRK
jgi:ribosomal protein S18 acetylase RimI-like enzyme